MTTMDNFPALVGVIKQGMTIGLHTGAAVHVRHRGEIVADFTLGAASLSPVTALRPEHHMLWLSAGKPLTALAIGILTDRGRLTFDALVCDFIPDFARHGKDKITLRHLLTHTHAYRIPRLDWPRMSRDEIIKTICDAPLIEGQKPGDYAAYDPQTGWYLLSEIVERTTGIANHEFVKREILDPLGCDGASIGMAADAWEAERASGELAVLHDTTGSARARVDLSHVMDGAAMADQPGATEAAQRPHPWAGDDALRAAAHNPAGGALGAARDLAAIYQCLLDGGNTMAENEVGGTALLRESTIQEMTSRQRVGFKDHSFGQVVDWGLGFLVNSARYGAPADPYGYGRHASDATFGHGGMQSSAGYADPENALAVAIIFNGLPGEPKHQKRVNDTNTALYKDLKISS